MIKIGILNNSPYAADSIMKIQQLADFEVSGIFNQVEYTKSPFALESLLENSSAIYFDQNNAPGYELLKMIIRRSCHIFFQQPFQIKTTELKELVSLQQEAESVIQINNPFLFDREMLKIYDKLESPRLTEVNISVDSKEKIEAELLNVLLFLIKTDPGGLRKIDVFALQGERHLVINLHIHFSSGSVSQLTFNAGEEVEQVNHFFFYTKNHAPIGFKVQPSKKMNDKNELNALGEFANKTMEKEAIILSLSDLQLATLAMQEINEKLKYPEIRLSD